MRLPTSIQKVNERVQRVGVGNLVARVDAVHARNGALAPGAVVAVFDELGDEQLRVVVALLRALGELPRAGQEPADAGDGEGAEQGELERTLAVPRELDEARDEHDALVIAEGIELGKLGMGRPSKRHVTVR
jgi:hypothetical protein